MSTARGTMRQRSPGSWQLRANVGLDAAGKPVQLAALWPWPTPSPPPTATERRWPSASPARQMTTLAMSGILVEGFARSRDLVRSACPPTTGRLPPSRDFGEHAPQMHHKQRSTRAGEGRQGSG